MTQSRRSEWLAEYDMLIRQGKYIEAAVLALSRTHRKDIMIYPEIPLPLHEELKEEILAGRSIVVRLEGDRYKVSVGKFAPDLIMSVDELHELMDFADLIRKEKGNPTWDSWDVTKTEDGTVILDQSWEDRIATKILYPEQNMAGEDEGTAGGTRKEEEDDNVHKS